MICYAVSIFMLFMNLVSPATSWLGSTEQLVWYFMCGEVQVGEIRLRCDGLAGPRMVGFGSAWCSCMGVFRFFPF